MRLPHRSRATCRAAKLGALALCLTSLFALSLGEPEAREKKRGPGTACNIKGNISVKTGEKIYHLSGQRYYDATKIRRDYGERWFCTEAEARRAGWRKSKV